MPNLPSPQPATFVQGADTVQTEQNGSFQPNSDWQPLSQPNSVRQPLSQPNSVRQPPRQPKSLRVAHSPDADDRFMFWPLREQLIPLGELEGKVSFEFWERATGDLNALASLEGEACPEVCAISAAHYLKVSTKYRPLKMGSSVGNDYGPVVIANSATKALLTHSRSEASRAGSLDADLLQKNLCEKLVFLTPGKSTTAHGVASLLGLVQGAVEEVSISPLERVFERLSQLEREGAPAIALLIHEGRLTYKTQGYELISDIGRDWQSKFGKSLPLGINVIKRNLSSDLQTQLAEIFSRSFSYAAAHRDQYIELAQDPKSPYWSPLSRDQMAHYLDLYANETTGQISSDDALSFEFLLKRLNAHEGCMDCAPPVFDWI